MRIFSEALGILVVRWKTVVTACFLPLAGAALVEAVPVGDESLMTIPLGLAQLYFYTCIAVAVHRVVLLGPDSVPVLGVMLSISRRELRFAGFMLLFAGLIYAALLLMGNVFFLSLVALGAMLYFVPVFFIVFPAVAVDSELTLRELLSVGHSHYWLLAKATLVVPLVVALLVQALGEAAVQVFGDLPPTLAAVTGQVVAALVLVIEIGVLSVAYGEIERRESAEAVFGT